MAKTSAMILQSINFITIVAIIVVNFDYYSPIQISNSNSSILLFLSNWRSGVFHSQHCSIARPRSSATDSSWSSASSSSGFSAGSPLSSWKVPSGFAQIWGLAVASAQYRTDCTKAGMACSASKFRPFSDNFDTF